MEEHNTTNEKETKHKQYDCPCCKTMIGLHNKARHEKTKRHKDNLITVKEETQTEEPKTETETETTSETKTRTKTEAEPNVDEDSEIYKRLQYMTLISGDCF